MSWTYYRTDGTPIIQNGEAVEQTIDYKLTWSDGGTVVTRVTATDINGGFAEAVRRGTTATYNGRTRELARVEFWQVV